MVVVGLRLVHKRVVLGDEKAHGPRAEVLVEMVFHRVHCQGHHVVRVFYELAGNLASLGHLGRLAVEQDVVSHGPLVLRVRFRDINSQETNFIFELNK